MISVKDIDFNVVIEKKKIKGVLTPKHMQEFYRLEEKYKREVVSKKKAAAKPQQSTTTTAPTPNKKRR